MTTDDDLPRYPMSRDPRCPMDPPADYARLRRDRPITRVRIWDGSTPWLITRYDHVIEALADRRLTMEVQRTGYPHTSPASAARSQGNVAYPFRAEADHLAQSSMLAREFSARRLEARRPEIQRIVDEAIDDLEAGPRPADLVDRFAMPVAILVICDLLGMPRSAGGFLHATSRIVGSRTADRPTVGAALDELRRYFAALVAAALRAPGDDLLGRIVTERVRPGELSPEDATSMIETLYFAGHGPTGYMIAMGIAALLQHPSELARLRAADRPDERAAAIDELLRYLTVSHNARQRVAVEDVVIGGQLIRAGEGVLIQIDSANRDEAAFADPDRLDLGRPPRRHVALGHGVHICLGRALARLELEIAFTTLIRRIPTLRIAVPFDQISFKTDENLVGVHELPVTW
jgi:cytochrome P450